MPQRRRDCSLGASTRRSDGRAARNRFGENVAVSCQVCLGCAVYDTEAKAFGLLVSLAASSGVRKRPEQLQAAPETRTAHTETSERAFPGLRFCPNYFSIVSQNSPTCTQPHRRAPVHALVQSAQNTLTSNYCKQRAPPRRRRAHHKTQQKCVSSRSASSARPRRARAPGPIERPSPGVV